MLAVNEYLKSPPAWARDGAEDRFKEALDHLGLKLGRNPSSCCPHDGHELSSDENVVAYPNGVMCYSQHGFIPREVLIKMAGLPLGDACMGLSDLVSQEVRRFVADDQLSSMLRAGVNQRLRWPNPRARVAVACLIACAKRHYKEDPWWAERLKHIFHAQYPRREFGFWTNNRIAHQPHHVPNELESLSRPEEQSYQVEILNPRRQPGPQLAVKLAPALAAVSEKGGGSPSASTDRFLAGESWAVMESTLTAVECFDRPVPTVEGGWRLPTHKGELPRMVKVAQLTKTEVDRSAILKELSDDLDATFAFEDEEALVRYLAYLIQPMLIVFAPGRFPGYGFTGPTQCGKTDLAGPFPQMIYQHNVGNSVFITRIPKSDYELAVQLDAHQGTVFTVFDEAIDMTNEQTKILDQLITSPVLVSRKMRVGYLTRPNYVTFAFTAVAKSLPPETAGRILEIRFTESRPEEIAEFHKKWRSRGPEVLRALFDSICAVDKFAEGEHVAERRPGFGILKRVLRDGLSREAVFGIMAYDDDILDLVCQAHFNKLGTDRPGGWLRLSFSRLARYYSENTRLRATKKTMEQKVNVCLGYGSTRRHPVYRHTGYRAESGLYYDIELRSESDGRANNRSSLYVREFNKPSHSASPDESQKAEVVPPDSDLTQPASAVFARANTDSGATEFDVSSLEQEMLRGPNPND